MKILNINNNSNNFKILDQKIGDILNKIPPTKEFFEKYNIDYCCDGRKILKDVLNEMNLNKPDIIQELISIVEKGCEFKPSGSDEVIKSTDFINKSNQEVIDYILSHFHEGLRKTLPELNASLLKIMRAHIKKHKVLYWKLHELLHKLTYIIEGHLILEEENIFNTMLNVEKGKVSKDSEEYKTMMEGIQESMNEHSIMGPTLKEMASLTNNYTPPEDACQTVIDTYKEFHKLQDHLLAHTQLENNILFPRFLNK